MANDLATIAHILRRTTFGPHPGQVEQFARLGVSGTIDSLLNGPVERLSDAVVTNAKFEGYDALPLWWLERMRQPSAGLHEKLVWYWHGHFTSSLDKASDKLLFRQHNVLRTHALGNFRELVQALAIDGAMVRFLDGDGSRGDAPNENFARELMELFCLGPGNYSEEDIRAAARAFAGWRVDDEKGTVTFDAESAYNRPVSFFGQRQRWDARSAVDAIVNQPACARHIARRLWAFYVASPPTDKKLDELATTFRNAKLEIKPLVEAILRSKEFLEAHHTRPRQPVEWLLAMLAATGFTKRKIELWWLEQLGQVPFRPPNVAGWPLDNRWASAGQMLIRTSLVTNLELEPKVIDEVPAQPAAVLARCGIHDASAATRAALDRAIASQTEYDHGLELLLTLALTSPEFSLA